MAPDDAPRVSTLLLDGLGREPSVTTEDTHPEPSHSDHLGTLAGELKGSVAGTVRVTPEPP